MQVQGTKSYHFPCCSKKCSEHMIPLASSWSVSTAYNQQAAIGLRSQIYLSALELSSAPIFLLESWFNTWLYSTFPTQRLPSRHGIKGRWQTLITSMYHALNLASPFQIHSPAPKVELFRLESLRAFPRHELLNGVMHLDRIEYLATS